MHILYLHSSGYLIFKAKEFEEIGIAIQSVKKSYDDIKKFFSLVKLQMFYPFCDCEEANDNWNYIHKENSIPPTMKKVLAKFGSKNIQSLGLEFTNLTDALKETLEIKVSSNAYVMEIIRCIRYHVPAILKKYLEIEHDKLFRKSLIFKVGDSETVSASNGINLTNNYNLLKDIESFIPVKTANLRKLIQPFYPELKSVALINNQDFPSFISIYFDDKVSDKWSECQKIIGSDKIVAIKKAMKNTIGSEINKLDSNLIKEYCDDLLETINKYNSCKNIAYNATKKLAPNLTCFLELSSQKNNLSNVDLSASEIIAKAGSLKKLAEKSSTAIHTQNKKNDSLLKRNKVYSCQRSSEDKLRSVQLKSLSDKCALAARMDYFGSQDITKTLNDAFGRECYKNHLLRMNTWANNNAININFQNKDELNQRAKKYKLKRKEKKRLWRQRKNDKQKDILFENTIDVNMED